MRLIAVVLGLMLVPVAAAESPANPYCTIEGSVIDVAGDKAAKIQIFTVAVAERSADEYAKQDCMVSSGKVQPFQLVSKPSGMTTGDTIRGVAHFEQGMKLQNITITKDTGGGGGPLARIAGAFRGFLGALPI